MKSKLCMLLCAALAFVLAADCAWAGQPRNNARSNNRNARQSAAANASDDEEELSEQEKLEAMPLSELRKYQSYVYVGGGRDPMTMYGTSQFSSDMTSTPSSGRDLDALTSQEEILAELDLVLDEIIFYTRIRDFTSVLDITQKTLSASEEKWAGMPGLHDKLSLVRDYQAVADRMIARQEAERRLAALNIQIQGTSVTPMQSMVYISGKAYYSGEYIDPNHTVRLDSISQSGIVLAIDGYRLHVPAQMYVSAENKFIVNSLSDNSVQKALQEYNRNISFDSASIRAHRQSTGNVMQHRVRELQSGKK